MRLKKQKRHRKVVRFYTACFGFRQPFKVLCDGTFVHHIVLNRITPADNALSNILGAPVKLFTTRCVLAELKSLGDSHFESLNAAYNLVTARCDHEKRKRAEDCITDIIGENNPEHFFVATQDTGLRKKFQEISGVPVIFGLRNALFLEPPSAVQRQLVKVSEEERLHMTDLEYNMLKNRAKNRLVTEEVGNSSDENEDVGDKNSVAWGLTKTHTGRKEMEVKDKAQFKRKKAKGPNPLSCKKKKNRENSNPVSPKEIRDGGNTMGGSEKKRKRSRRARKHAEKDG